MRWLTVRGGVFGAGFHRTNGMGMLAAVAAGLLWDGVSPLQAGPPPSGGRVATDFGAASNEGNGLAIDADGNVYLTGQASITAFRDGVRYGELAGEEFVHGGAMDFFLMKFDPDLRPLWTRTLGGGQFEYGTAVRVGPGGDAFVTGTFQSDFQAGGRTVDNVTQGRADGFVARYRPDGSLVWLTPLTAEDDLNLDDLEVDAEGNSYVVGRLYGQTTVGGTLLGDRFQNRAILVRLGPDGDVDWAATVVGTRDVGAISVQLPTPDRVLVAGGLNASIKGLFLAEYSSGGGRRWIEEWSTGRTEEVSGLEVAADGAAYLSGRIQGTGFDLGGGVMLPNPDGRFTGYLLKVSANREPLWVAGVGTRGFEVALDPEGHPVVTGYYDDTVPTVGGAPQPLAGGIEAYVAGLDSAGGSLNWVVPLATPDTELCRALAVAPDGSVVFVGEGTGDTVGVSPFRGRVFLARLGGIPVDPPVPSLCARWIEGQLEVSWPTDAGAFVLEAAAGLGQAFTAEGLAPVPVEGQPNTFRIPTEGTARFLRLRRAE